MREQVRSEELKPGPNLGLIDSGGFAMGNNGRVSAISLLSICLLGGCVQYQWQKDGATQDEFNRDSYQCQIEAARAYPTQVVAQQTAPTYTVPAQTQCTGSQDAMGLGNYAYGSSSMNCTTTPARQIGGGPEMVDVNANNRTEAAKACLFARGYQLVQVK